MGFILVFVQVSIKERYLPFSWGNPRIEASLKQYSLDKGKFDVVFFGSSRIFRHVAPKIVDKELRALNMRSFNFGVLATRSPQAVFIMDRVLDRKETKYAIIELSEFFYPSPEYAASSRRTYWLSFLEPYYIMTTAKIHLEQILTDDDTIYIKSLGHFINAVFRNALGLGLMPKYLNSSSGEKKKLPELRRGHISVEDEILANLDTQLVSHLKKRRHFFLENTGMLEELKNGNLVASREAADKKVNKNHLRWAMQKIADFKKRDIDLIFLNTMVNTPYLAKLYSELPIESKVDMTNFKQNFEQEYLFDVGHFNNKGVKLYSQSLAGKIRKLIIKKRGDR